MRAIGIGVVLFGASACCEEFIAPGAAVELPERIVEGAPLTVAASVDLGFNDQPCGAKPECRVEVRGSILDVTMVRFNCTRPFEKGSCEIVTGVVSASCVIPGLPAGEFELFVDGAPLPLRRTFAVTSATP